MDWERFQAWISVQRVDDDTWDGLGVAAHAYAAAVDVYENARPQRAAGAVRRGGSLAASLRGVVAAEGALARYEALLAVLLACEADLADPARRAGLPPSTVLDAESGLAGTVHHAWKGAGIWRQRRHRRREDLGPGATSYELRPDDQLDHLWFAWSRGEPLRYARLDRSRVSGRRVMTALGDGIERGTLRLALCPLSGVSGPRFRVTDDGDHFLACPEHAPSSEAELGAIVTAAREEEIGLLLFPELHVRPEELPALDEVGAILTVAGSFHVGAAEARNRAPVLVDAGHRLWEHDKRGYFRVPGRVAHRGDPFVAPTGRVGPELCEDIVGGGPLTVLDTSLGRIAVVICADALESDGYVRAIEDARPDLLLIVSMSPETAGFETRAQELERLGVSTLYVNAGPRAALSALCWLAVEGSAELPPTRIRWSMNAGVESWRPRAGWKAGGGAVAHVHEVLGLVVEIGCMVSDGKSDDDLAN